MNKNLRVTIPRGLTLKDCLSLSFFLNWKDPNMQDAYTPPKLVNLDPAVLVHCDEKRIYVDQFGAADIGVYTEQCDIDTNSFEIFVRTYDKMERDFQFSVGKVNVQYTLDASKLKGTVASIKIPVKESD